MSFCIYCSDDSAGVDHSQASGNMKQREFTKTFPPFASTFTSPSSFTSASSPPPLLLLRPLDPVLVICLKIPGEGVEALLLVGNMVPLMGKVRERVKISVEIGSVVVGTISSPPETQGEEL